MSSNAESDGGKKLFWKSDELHAKPKYYFSRYVVDNGLSNRQDLKTFS